MKIQVILGSTRPNRVGKGVADWVYETLSKRDDAEYELVDVADFNLPLLDEPQSPMMHQYEKEHTKRWSKKISEADGYIFVTAEYNHSVPGALKNAIDFLYDEWNDKAVGFVSYGSIGGVRSVEHLRAIVAEVRMADVREHLKLFLGGDDFKDWAVLQPTERHAEALNKVADQVVSWASALKPLREQLPPEETAG